MPPFFIFLSGGGGVGKSHVLKTVYHGIIHTLRQSGQDPSEVSVILTAPTGTASFNIGGMTIHSALQLPVKERKKYNEQDYIPLSSEKKNTLRCKLKHLKILIIDEVSMVGSHTLINIHKRLQEIKGIVSDDIPFGGVSVLAVGDLLQLPPVGDSPVYGSTRDPLQQLNLTLWEKHFYLLELTEVQRQRGDPQFAEILNRVRIGQQTEIDIDTLSSRVHTDSLDNLHIFATNHQVDTFNAQRMTTVIESIIEIKAEDQLSHKPAKQSVKITTDRHFTGGLHEVLHIAVGARVSLVKNIDVSDGLVNGADGVIVKIDISKKFPLKGTVFLHFENSEVGRKAKDTLPPSLRALDAVPVKAQTVTFTLGKTNTLKITRTQYPLTLAWGATIHKVQGKTLNSVTVSFDCRFTAGQAYVALSRAKSISGLHLLNFDPAKLIVNKTALAEMNRLKENRALQCKSYIYTLKDHGHTIITHLNVRSLKAHNQDISIDQELQLADVIALTETYSLSPQNMSDYSIFSRNTTHGLSALIKTHLRPQRLASIEHVSLEVMLIQIQIRDQPTTLMILYNPPSERQSFFQALQNQIQCLPTGPVVLLGDFNCDLKKSEKILNTLPEFQQLIQEPTHRSGGILDHIYVKHLTAVYSGTCFKYYSDHVAIYVAV